MLQIRDLEVAAARFALAPSVTSKTAKELNAIPITGAMGIRLEQSIRSMAHIVANGNGADFFTAVVRCRETKKCHLQIWRLQGEKP